MLRVIVGISLNQKQKTTLGSSWGCLLAGMKMVISELIGLWQKRSMSFWCVSWSREMATQSAIFAAGWSGELDQSWGWCPGSIRAGRWFRSKVTQSGGLAKEVLKEFGWEVRELLAKMWHPLITDGLLCHCNSHAEDPGNCREVGVASLGRE